VAPRIGVRKSRTTKRNGPEQLADAGTHSDAAPRPTAGPVAVVFGTRPEIIKLARIIQLLGTRARTLFSGQHFDDAVSRRLFEELGLPPPDVVLAVGGLSRAQQIGQVVLALESQFNVQRPAVVVVQGDTTTALGGAIAANALDLPLVHVEAGLRSFDRRMPEEHNRVVIDHLADLCLAPTAQARDNLLAERVPPERIVVTGNTVVDVASRVMPAREERAEILGRHDVEAGRFILATFHRPENVEDAGHLRSVLWHLGRLGRPVLFPVHPRTRQRLNAFGIQTSGDAAVRMIPPVGYKTFLALAAECAFLVSDSGGIQEEATVVKRPAIVVRRSTERPEAMGTFCRLVPELADLTSVAGELLARLDEAHRELAATSSPYGDGEASLRSVHHIEAFARRTYVSAR
jgi:UDP-N-acetylglucosamine 2-epimerase (non-hydrolysing)